MVMPSDIAVIDTMIGFPHGDMKATYKFITDQTRDSQSKDEFEFPAEYMFKDVPDKHFRDVEDPIGLTVREMDLWGIAQGLIGVTTKPDDQGAQALERFPGRFIPGTAVPNCARYQRAYPRTAVGRVI